MASVPGTQKTPLEKARLALEEEVGKWQKLGIDHNSTVHTASSLFDFKIKFMSFHKIVKEKLGITDEEVNLAYCEVMLEQMQELREHVEQQRAAQGTVVEVPKLGILGPNGEVLKGF
jgi:hypothetical protein